ncbi:MAG: helix-turn-helix transcriptional regulator [PVC group bacterium]|nr:helix-turn-helix transcriptional regulator [PVC group bacterium]
MRIHNHRLMLDKLEKYRLEHRLSQKALGEKLGVAFSTINRWFNHRTRPNKIQRYHIEKLLRNWYG